MIAILDHAGTAGLEQIFEGLRCEARARKAQEAEFLGIDQAPGAVVLEHQLVFVDRRPGASSICDGAKRSRMILKTSG